LDPDAAPFVLHETGVYSPPDRQLNPRVGYNEVMTALWAALEPRMPAA